MTREKQILLMMIPLLLVLLYVNWLTTQGTMLSNQDFIRFHVVANGNSEEEQALKLKVRDGVLESLNETILDSNRNLGEMDIDEIRAYIKANTDEITKIAKEVIAEEGYDYSVLTNLSIRWIPEKTYGNVIFPAGNYEALNIIIGEGSGENWWCVVYPPLCLVDSGDEELLTGKYRGLVNQEDEPKKLQLKFKTYEILKGERN